MLDKKMVMVSRIMVLIVFFPLGCNTRPLIFSSSCIFALQQVHLTVDGVAVHRTTNTYGCLSTGHLDMFTWHPETKQAKSAQGFLNPSPT
jgi:hypothetical protein